VLPEITVTVPLFRVRLRLFSRCNMGEHLCVCFDFPGSLLICLRVGQSRMSSLVTDEYFKRLFTENKSPY